MRHENDPRGQISAENALRGLDTIQLRKTNIEQNQIRLQHLRFEDGR
jgi:hypothetical protein